MTRYSEGNLDSLLTISTCSGLKGILPLHVTVFHIDSIYTLKNFEHIYSLSLKLVESWVISGDEQDELFTTSQFQRRIEPSSVPTSCMWTFPKYVEIVYCV